VLFVKVYSGFSPKIQIIDGKTKSLLPVFDSPGIPILHRSI